MNVIYTILFAFAIGFFVKNRGPAILTYLVLGAIVFTFQTLGVLLDWLSGGTPAAFGPGPTEFPFTYRQSEYLAYGVVNLVVFSVGVGLTVLGTYVAARRAAKRSAVVVA